MPNTQSLSTTRREAYAASCTAVNENCIFGQRLVVRLDPTIGLRQSRRATAMAGKFTFDRRCEFDFIVVSPAGSPDAALAIAGSRAGALGVLNLEFANDHAAALAQLARLSQLGRGRWGALIDEEELLAAVLGARPRGLETIVLSNVCADRMSRLVRLVHRARLRAYVVATRLEDALAAQAARADVVIAKGYEAGGWVGDEGSFVLVQRLLAGVRTPVCVQGGIGLHTVAAAYVAGACGAVLDAQLLLARESPLPDDVRSRIAAMDGSETTILGSELGAPLRVYSRPDLPGVEELRAAEMAADDPEVWRAAARQLVGWRTRLRTAARACTARTRSPKALPSRNRTGRGTRSCRVR
jgi:NAD(P)H-dependent flavin oxidoreductase YrpB (nitropropane dioxygenase family)